MAIRSIGWWLYKSTQNIGRKFGLDLQVTTLPKKQLTNVTGNEKLLSSVNWLRYPMYSLIIEFLTNTLINLKDTKGIEIGGSEGTLLRAVKGLGCDVTVAEDYPKIDIEHLPYPDDSFDLVIFDQVLEHLKHPNKAVSELKRVLKDEGICIVTTVFLYPIHKGESYSDYFRFAPEGLEVLFEDFKMLYRGGSGNWEIVKLAYNHSQLGLAGTQPLPVTVLKERGLYDYTDNENYIMTWCVVQRK